MQKLGAENKGKVTLRGKAKNYRHCDDTWTFILSNCDIKFEDRSVKSNYCKIVVCDAGVGSGQVSKKPPPKSDKKKAENTKISAKKKKKEEKQKAHNDSMKKEVGSDSASGDT